MEGSLFLERPLLAHCRGQGGRFLSHVCSSTPTLPGYLQCVSRFWALRTQQTVPPTVTGLANCNAMRATHFSINFLVAVLEQ